jgi:hypothetical protein
LLHLIHLTIIKMKKLKSNQKKVFFISIVFLLNMALGCEEESGKNALEDVNSVEKYDYVSSIDEQMAASTDSINIPELPECVADYLDSLPSEPLSVSEIQTLNFVREEELLAHDVYVSLYAAYNLPVFHNISKSESFHTMMIQALLQKYQLDDPAADHIAGTFVNPELQQYYDDLIALGITSINNAIVVGATIEDLDINDLYEHLTNDVDNQDISFVLLQLSKGSRNHLRAFHAHLSFRNITYTPAFITQEQYDEIVNSDWEIGGGICGICQ